LFVSDNIALASPEKYWPRNEVFFEIVEPEPEEEEEPDVIFTGRSEKKYYLRKK
jgi:hypothetical protein